MTISEGESPIEYALVAERRDTENSHISRTNDSFIKILLFFRHDNIHKPPDTTIVSHRYQNSTMPNTQQTSRIQVLYIARQLSPTRDQTLILFL